MRMSDRKITIFIKDCKPIILTDNSKDTTLEQLEERLTTILNNRHDGDVVKFTTDGDIVLIPSESIMTFMISYEPQQIQTVKSKPSDKINKIPQIKKENTKVKNDYIDEEILTSLLKKAEMPESEITRIIFEAKLKTAMKRKLSSDFFKIKKEKEKANES